MHTVTMSVRDTDRRSSGWPELAFCTNEPGSPPWPPRRSPRPGPGPSAVGVADVLEQHDAALPGRDGDVVQLLDLVHHHVAVEQHLVIAEVGGARRHHHV